METSLAKVKKGAHIHLIGICGTAMGSLAGILKSMGFQISGSDQNVYPPMSTQLESIGVKLLEGYRAENLNPRPDLVIIGNVISKGNPEADKVLSDDIPYTSLPKALGEFVIGERESLVVAGTHGKTTTTSMLAWALESCQLQPGFLIGGIPENFTKSFQAPQNNYFVIEGDEYDTAFFDKVPKFVHYRPKHVILTSIEFDHADIYVDLEAVKSAFRRLIQMIPANGTLVACAEDKNIGEMLAHCKGKVVTYGLNQGDYRAIDRAAFEGRSHFCVEHNGARVADVALKMFGEHNTLNALAVFALTDQMRMNQAKVLQSLASFKGVKRRQQFLGEPGGVALVEDFAHHPTAVKMTIQSIRERFPRRRVLAVFEPRSATSRRKIFQEDYVRALGSADAAFIAQAFDQSKINEGDRFSSDQLVSDIQKSGTKAWLGQNVDALVDLLGKESQKGDVILVMSNGGFGGIYQKLMERLGSS